MRVTVVCTPFENPGILEGFKRVPDQVHKKLNVAEVNSRSHPLVRHPFEGVRPPISPASLDHSSLAPLCLDLMPHKHHKSIFGLTIVPSKSSTHRKSDGASQPRQQPRRSANELGQPPSGVSANTKGVAYLIGDL